ncbi:MAG TPA: putative ABC exporter domain-containing protein [Nitrososphaerales archaeon]|nr:putative ABC exporter domain-containing protein [Nitrososphaerales archaeon]
MDGGRTRLAGWPNIAVLMRYWLKGRITRAALLWMVFGEGFAILFIAFGSQTFLAFSSKFGVTGGFSNFALSLLLAFLLIGLLQSGFSGSGLPITSADVDYVFTSPVRPREIFVAKVLITSLATVLFSFPPMMFLYVRLALFYGAPVSAAIPAGLATLLFLVLGLVLSADVTLSLSSTLGPRLKVLRNVLIVSVAVIGILPVILLIPGAPLSLNVITQILPSGLTADISIGLVNGSQWTAGLIFEAVLLIAWFAAALALGFRMSRGHFYEVLQVVAGPGESGAASGGGRVAPLLETSGKSVWEVVRRKEAVVMRRTKERRGLLISSLFLSAFMVIYSLAGSFQSSPTSFLFILFLIGSFGSGSAGGWLEKERLWIMKTTSIDLRKYVRGVYRARITPLLLILTPVTAAVGVPLVLGRLGQSGPLLGVVLALPSALEVAAIMMGGGIYFASRYGQSATDDILTTQAQQLTDVKRFLYQTIVNLALVSPVMGLVLLAAQPDPVLPLPLLAYGGILLVGSLGYTYLVLKRLLDGAGDWILRREDL